METLFSWLQFLGEQKIVLHRKTESVQCQIRFYLHSWKYKFPGICPNRSHDASRRHNQAVREKEHEEAVVAGRSLPHGTVVQHAPSNSSIVQ